MNLQKCLGMVLIWVACLLISTATEAEAQSYGSSDAPEALCSHSMLVKFLGLLVSFLVLKEIVWILWWLMICLSFCTAMLNFLLFLLCLSLKFLFHHQSCIDSVRISWWYWSYFHMFSSVGLRLNLKICRELYVWMFTLSIIPQIKFYPWGT